MDLQHAKPPILFKKCAAASAVRLKTHNNRAPDIGRCIVVTIEEHQGVMIEYYGEYIGHGQSKTAFELYSEGERFHGKVLKVSKTQDIEPGVFMEASKTDLTPTILYQAIGMDVESKQSFHCWIMDRVIPLDELCGYEGVIKSKCSLAAFHCILRAAEHGLYLSDCHFFNFGVCLDENATEHRVIIIDAGSRGIHPDKQWKKSEITTKIMHKFWRACRTHSATNKEIEKMWHVAWNVDECVKKTTTMLGGDPFLTEAKVSTKAIWQAMNAKEDLKRSNAQATSAYKIIELAGRFTARKEWSGACALVCYRAAKCVDDLSPAEYDILDELYERLTGRTDEEVQDVLAFWGRLHDYRRQELYWNNDQTPTPDQAIEMINSFKYNILWYELTFEERRIKQGWWSKTNTILHHKAAWKHAATAIMEFGLPELKKRNHSVDATEHIEAMDKFAHHLATWLKNFATSMYAYKQTEAYKQNFATSLTAVNKKWKRAKAK